MGRLHRDVGRSPADAGEIATHLARVGGSVLGGTNPFTFAIVLVALLGLALECRKGKRRVQARFLLALPLLAFVAALARQIPFGTTQAPRSTPADVRSCGCSRR